MCKISEEIREEGRKEGADELIKAIQFIKEGSSSIKELTEKGISYVIAEKALQLGIK